ncbi:DgyrCDS3613 [Dimorphilus gyrociliatus]|uniref:RNA helicase n=1 Tax=Dimorphilus gyrociliatus TaxID=2664684 RepID=A0A7I8VIV0_9ANNE|nr:DgyrCDS3613 [Dimorphilus gyrociliatus]
MESMACNFLYDTDLKHMLSFFSNNKISGHMKPADVKNELVDNEKALFIEPYKPHQPIFLRLDCEHLRETVQEDYKRKLLLMDEIDSRNNDRQSIVSGGLDSIMVSTKGNDFPLYNEEELMKVYRKFDFDDYSGHTPLPIDRSLEEITDMIKQHPVVIIKGSTGCGKSTRVPQAILDDCRQRNVPCKMIVTQPRRIAAVTVAKRVCDERKWVPGTVVGHQIGLESLTSESTCITYATTGVLLQKLVKEKNMNSYTHVILDEIHERDEDTDFCLLIVRKFLHMISPNIKVVLMSATMETSDFSDYFYYVSQGEIFKAPSFTIDQKVFDVTEYFLDDLTKILPGSLPDFNEPEIQDKVLQVAVNLILEFDKMEMKERNEISPDGLVKSRGSVLVFLPGRYEISQMTTALESHKNEKKWNILPLHSDLTIHEQRYKVFESRDCYERKIILSTNIAESSITVPDVKYVLDFCLTRYNRCNKATNITSLVLEWASKASCNQRRGRAGRVSSGRCYRMVTKSFYEELPDYTEPEMTRVSLDHLVLKSKLLEPDTPPTALLGLAIDPPYLSDIGRTIVSLREIGAMFNVTVDSTSVEAFADGELSYLGEMIGKLPIDVRFGKLIMMGHAFGLLEEAIIIASGLGGRSIFATPYQQDIESYNCKLKWANYSQSDSIAILNAYRTWREKKNRKQFGESSGMRTIRGRLRRDVTNSEKEWAKRNYLQYRQLYELDQQVEQIKYRLECEGIHIRVKRKRMPPEEEQILLKIMLSASFYPNYFVKTNVDECDIRRELSGRNPDLCCLLKGLPYPEGILYKESLRTQCQKLLNTDVQLDIDGSKAILHFPKDINNTWPFPSVLYRAVKYGHIKGNNFRIHRVSSEEESCWMKQIDDEREQFSLQNGSLRSPLIIEADDELSILSPYIEKLSLRPTVIINCNLFYANNLDYEEELKYIDKMANKSVTYLREKEIRTGSLVAAPYYSSGNVCYYRAKIRSIDISKKMASVFYIDYGNIDLVELRKLKALPDSIKEIPGQALKCCLAGVCPAFSSYTQEQNQHFSDLLLGQESLPVVGKIYSVINDEIRITLYIEELNVNRWLIDRNICKELPETAQSKREHEKRSEYQKDPSQIERNKNYKLSSNAALLVKEFEDKRKDGSIFPSRIVKLKGPYSPIESTYTMMTSVGSQLTTVVSPNSVNSVPLDDSWREDTMRMMVGGDSILTGRRLQMRSTTILPNISGLTSLVPLLFCPFAEYRINKRGQIVGAICGLGYEIDTNNSIHPDNDIEVEFDVELTELDLELINKVRQALSIIVGRKDNLQELKQQAICQDILHDNLLLLLRNKRNKLNSKAHSDYKTGLWNRIDQEKLISGGYDDISEVVFPAHKLIKF